MGSGGGPAFRLLWLLTGVLAAGLATGCRPPTRAVPVPADPADSLQAALRQNPDDLGAHLKLIRHYASRGRLLSALEAAEFAGRRLPDSVPITIARADALLAVGRPDEAVALVRKEAPANPRMALQLARYLIRAGRPAEARKALPAPHRLTRAERVEAAALALDALAPELALTYGRPGDAADPVLAETAGVALAGLGRHAEARETLRAALAAGRRTPELLATLGTASRLANPPALEEARRYLEEAAAAQPRSGLVAYELALVHVQLREAAAAAEALQRAAGLAPEIPEIQRDLARICEKTRDPAGAALARGRYLTLMEDYAAARSVLLPAFARHPDHRALALAVAEAHYDNHDTHLARRVLESQAGREREREGRVEVLWARFRMERELAETDLALKVLDLLAAEKEPEARLLDARVDLLSRALRYPDARAAAARLAELEPGVGRHQLQLGRLYFLDRGAPNREAHGLAALRTALRLQPDDAEVHYTLGLLLHSMNQSGRAIPHFYRAVDLRPEWEEAWGARAQAHQRVGDLAGTPLAMAAKRRLEARRKEVERLMLPGKTGRATLESRWALVRDHLSRGDYVPAARVLETILHRAPTDRRARELLLPLLAHARRFQRLEEERPAGAVKNRSVSST